MTDQMETSSLLGLITDLSDEFERLSSNDEFIWKSYEELMVQSLLSSEMLEFICCVRIRDLLWKVSLREYFMLRSNRRQNYDEPSMLRDPIFDSGLGGL